MSSVSVTTTQREFTIVLNESEAVALYRVCRKIGGFPNGSRGTFSDLMDRLLERAPDLRMKSDLLPLNGELYFKDGN